MCWVTRLPVTRASLIPLCAAVLWTAASPVIARGAEPQEQTRRPNRAERDGRGQGPASPLVAPEGVRVVGDIAYRTGNGAWKLDLAMPETFGDAPRPAIVFVHGGGWRSGDKRRGYFLQGALAYAQKGYVCITVNYRLTSEAPFPACIEDVKCAVRWLRAHADQYDVDPERIGGFGNSAGAHLVAMLALTGPDDKLEGDGPYQDQSSAIQAACCAAPPTDLANWGGEGRSFRGEATLLAGAPESLAERKRLSSPIAHAHSGAPPFLIIHGTDDRTVPFQQGESFAKALRAAGATDVTFLGIDGGSHGVFMQRSDVTYPATEVFFARVLDRPATTDGDRPAAAVSTPAG